MRQGLKWDTKMLISLGFVLSFLLIVLSGCGSTPTPTPAPTDTVVPPTSTPEPVATPMPTPTSEVEPISQGAFQPLDASACSELAEDMEEVLGVEPVMSGAPFQDYISGEGGSGCQAEATGTGSDFGELPDVASKLQEMLEGQGWEQNIQYQADGPAGTVMGFNKDNGLCLLSINWIPSEDADCPDDQPLAACDLKPEQKLFTIVLNCAQTDGS